MSAREVRAGVGRGSGLPRHAPLLAAAPAGRAQAPALPERVKTGQARVCANRCVWGAARHKTMKLKRELAADDLWIRAIARDSRAPRSASYRYRRAPQDPMTPVFRSVAGPLYATTPECGMLRHTVLSNPAIQ